MVKTATSGYCKPEFHKYLSADDIKQGQHVCAVGEVGGIWTVSPCYQVHQLRTSNTTQME
eukprot:12816041-Ditylum_brightwellii.AAC.1